VAARVEFGLFVNPSAASFQDTLELARAAEAGGIDLIGIQDHPYQYRFLDSWLLIANLMARTERLRFFPDVANLPLRPPALMATQAASLDVMSGGRFELGLGAGAFWPAIEAMGGPKLSPGESVDALVEAIAILRACWSGERTVDFEGEHYLVKGFHPGPPPAHPIEIWLGAYRPRMLRLTGRLADGWIPSLGGMPPEELVEARKLVDAAAEKAGRDPVDVRGLYNVSGLVTDGERGEGPLDGPPELWIETLVRWTDELSVTTFMLPAESVEQVERLAGEVVPGVRSALA
jgi:alkanesulfonate monooxygenase SsuD/methylene tetrahydromethanopterin reductase-like flavin-dependent oxidoreductase (luciferase family)